MVAGKVLMCDGEMLTGDEAAVRAEVQIQAEDVLILLLLMTAF